MELKENQGLLVKSNNLVEASYRLTAVEQKIILTLVSVIKKEDKEFQRYRFKTSNFLALLGIQDQSKYKEIPEIAEGLMKKIITIQEGKNTLKVAWLSGVKVLNGEGIVEMEFSPYLKPYLLQLKDKFTSYKLKAVIQLKSAYSVRFYELLKQYEKIGERTFELKKLRYILAIKENEYILYSDFKKRAILKAQQELKSKTDILFDFEEIKKNKKVIGIKFIIKSNINPTDKVCTAIEGKPTTKKNKVLCESISAIKAIFKENIEALEAKTLLDAAKGNINIIKEKYVLTQNVAKIDNVVGWMIDAIKRDYQIPKNKFKVDSFNDYPQRRYDYNDLEKKLLGWDNAEEDSVG